MSWNDVSFCPNLSQLTTKKISNLLIGKLFNGNTSVETLFNNRYEQMRRNCDQVPYDDNSWNLNGHSRAPKLYNPRSNSPRKAALLEVLKKNLSCSGTIVEQLLYKENFGLDMPTWMHKGETASRVMIISQDPLRRNFAPGKLVLSSPFGFHSHDYRAIQCQNKTLFALIMLLLENNICVYLTDRRKFFATDAKQILESDSAIQAFDRILDEEIRLFNPNLIVTLGNKAANYFNLKANHVLNVQSVNGRAIIPSYHTNARFNNLNLNKQVYFNTLRDVIARKLNIDAN